jgi:4-hydroxybenzoate polyprenyltransferase
MSATGNPGSVADAARDNWVDTHAPDWLKPYARLARWDRPIGFWLLFWPCGFALGLAASADPARGFDFGVLALCFVGAVLMRGAGCTFNDLVDRDIDMKVARTRLRPIPSGQVSARNAVLFLLGQSLLGLIVLLQFNAFSIWLGIGSLGLVAIYPFMKRVTWWPQLFLGLAFSWGALLAWATQTGGLSLAPVLLYLGCILWVIGYDTIYALQDIEDDALIGVRSTARLFGDRVKPIVGAFYGSALLLWLAAGLVAGAGPIFIIGLVLVGALMGWQVRTVDRAEPDNPLIRFRSNHWVGVVLTLALIVDWLA